MPVVVAVAAILAALAVAVAAAQPAEPHLMICLLTRGRWQSRHPLKVYTSRSESYSNLI